MLTASMHGPWQRLMWYSRHGRGRARTPSLMSMVQVRNGNSRRTRFIASSTRARRGVRPEVAAAVVGQPAGALDPREVVGERDLDVRVALVVLEPDVEARLEALDQVRLEEQRLGDRVGLGDLEVGDPVDGLADLVVPAAGARRLLLPVAADAAAQALRLAHVQHLALGVLHQVHAGPVGQVGEGRVELGGHASDCASGPRTARSPDTTMAGPRAGHRGARMSGLVTARRSARRSCWPPASARRRSRWRPGAGRRPASGRSCPA